MESIESKKTLQLLAHLIKTARVKQYTQNETSKRIGISRTTMSLIEKGSPKVSSGLYFEVLAVLGLTSQLNDFIKLMTEDYETSRTRASKSKVDLPSDF